jgi:hypothetical protein
MKKNMVDILSGEQPGPDEIKNISTDPYRIKAKPPDVQHDS